MSNKVYDVIKYIALIFIPALTTLLATLGEIWQIENMSLIVATIGAIGVFMGALLGISSIEYAKIKEGIYPNKVCNNFETDQPESENEEV